MRVGRRQLSHIGKLVERLEDVFLIQLKRHFVVDHDSFQYEQGLLVA